MNNWTETHRQTVWNLIDDDRMTEPENVALDAALVEIARLTVIGAALSLALDEKRAEWDAIRRAAFDELLDHFGRQWWANVGLLDDIKDLQDRPIFTR